MSREEFDRRKQTIMAIYKQVMAEREVDEHRVALCHFTNLFDECYKLLKLVKELGGIPEKTLT